MSISKKKYPLIFIILALLFTLTLPIINYITDPWRVLHKDYRHVYNGIGANFSYLKVSYILENPNKYDTLLFGSSRNFAINAVAVSDKSYNMGYTYGVVGIHLHNLKSLVKHTKIKSIWIGLNDFEIWKDPNDFYLDPQRRPYPLNFYESLSFYKLYLLQKIGDAQLSAISRKHPFEKSPRMINDKEEQYQPIKVAPYDKKHAIKLDTMGAFILEYKGDKYRIDKTINEIKEIKKLCENNNIELKLYFYPTFYKTYIYYNQYKIEEFKHKLASFTGFYDFYRLDSDAFNEMYWENTGHFGEALANKIISNIKAEKNYVDSSNIEKDLLEVRSSIINLVTKKYPVKDYIQRFNQDIDLSPLDKVFDLNSKNAKCKVNNQMQMSKKESYILLKAKADPYFIVNQMRLQAPNAILSLKIETPHKTIFQIYYKTKASDIYSENHAFRVIMREGEYSFNLLFPSKYLQYGLRIDPASNAGSYKVKKFAIYGVK